MCFCAKVMSLSRESPQSVAKFKQINFWDFQTCMFVWQAHSLKFRFNNLKRGGQKTITPSLKLDLCMTLAIVPISADDWQTLRVWMQLKLMYSLQGINNVDIIMDAWKFYMLQLMPDLWINYSMCENWLFTLSSQRTKPAKFHHLFTDCLSA